MPIKPSGLVYLLGVVAVRAKETSSLPPCQQFIMLLALLGAISGCHWTGERSGRIETDLSDDSASANSAANSASTSPEVVHVALVDHIVGADKMASSPMEQGPGNATRLSSDNFALPEPAALSLADAEALAVASHPELSVARSKVESVRGQYVQAGLPFNPVLQYQSDEIGNEDSSGLHSLSVSQQFVTANKLGIAQQVQAHAMQKQQAELNTAELRVLTRVRAAFAQALIAQKRVELTRQIVELTERAVASVESLLEAQEVSKVALFQARVEAEQAHIAAENAATQLEANRQILAAATGSASLPASTLAGDIGEGLTQRPWEQRLDEITSASPELAKSASELERARWALRLACAQITPNVTGQVGVGVDTVTDDTYATIAVSMPLPIRNRNQGNIRTARANVAAAGAAIDRTQLSLQSRFAEAMGRYQTAHQRYERITRNVLPNAEETYQLSQEAFDVGETDYLQLLTAQRTLFNTQLSVLESAAQAKLALAEIEGLLVGIKP